MPFNKLIALVFLLSFSVHSSNDLPKVTVFDREIVLPSFCGKIEKFSDGSVHVICEVIDTSYDAAWLSIKPLKDLELNKFQQSKELIEFNEFKLGTLIHYKIGLQFETSEGLKKVKLEVFCDAQECLTIMGDINNLLENIKAQIAG